MGRSWDMEIRNKGMTQFAEKTSPNSSRPSQGGGGCQEGILAEGGGEAYSGKQNGKRFSHEGFK